MCAEKRMIIAIDGPSGAGKSTAAKALAERLGYLYIDTGAMYRAVALEMRKRAIGTEDTRGLSQLLASIRLSFLNDGKGNRLLCNGEDVTEAIRTPEISRFASEISRSPMVREALVRIQREMGQMGGVVLEGRDIGTVVFPDADVKFYLDALPEERARRRHQELVGKGLSVGFEETLREVTERDRSDMSRSHSPLRKADDAYLIDSTDRSVEEVVEVMVRVIHEKRGSGEAAHR
ncbi:MAG: (d)CMP kinase [Desulfobacterota bacterium]|nr:(d)CMP kinase [Thermodesulfobacteriota bacterium]